MVAEPPAPPLDVLSRFSLVGVLELICLHRELQ